MQLIVLELVSTIQLLVSSTLVLLLHNHLLSAPASKALAAQVCSVLMDLVALMDGVVLVDGAPIIGLVVQADVLVAVAPLGVIAIVVKDLQIKLYHANAPALLLMTRILASPTKLPAMKMQKAILMAHDTADPATGDVDTVLMVHTALGVATEAQPAVHLTCPPFSKPLLLTPSPKLSAHTPSKLA